MAIQFNKSTAALKGEHHSKKGGAPSCAYDKNTGGGQKPSKPGLAGTQAPPVVSSFINTTNTGLKVKMPDSVHIFLPGETIEFIEKDLGPDGAQKELDRRARRHALKSKASVEWKRNKGKK